MKKKLFFGLLVGVGLLFGCTQGAQPAGAPPSGAVADPGDVDPKSLYEIEAKVSEGLSPGETGTLTLAIRPKAGAEVKAETPLRAKLQPTGPVELEADQLAYDDHKRVEGKGPVFEVPLRAVEAGEGEVDVDLTFFICTAELCMRTKEDLSLDYRIQ
jgi:hypothetical protein